MALLAKERKNSEAAQITNTTNSMYHTTAILFKWGPVSGLAKHRASKMDEGGTHSSKFTTAHTHSHLPIVQSDKSKIKVGTY